MKIIELRAENIKNLKVVEIRPGEDAVVLTGKNGAGKSAVLDSILLALTGKKIDEPIRDGESRAEINIDLGEYRIRKIFTAKGERLELMSAEGAVFKTPQALLDKILGKLTFDPLAFASMPQKQQRELLAGLVGLDFTELNKQREALYNERTIRNREIKGGDPTAYRKDPNAPLPLESLVGSMEKPTQGTPRQEISMAEAIAKVEDLEAKAKQYRTYEDEVQEILEFKAKCEETIDTKKKEIGELLSRIAFLEDDIANLTTEAQNAQKQAEGIAVPERIIEQQISDARATLGEVEKKNIIIRKAIEFDKAMETLEAARREVVKLEEGMAKIDLEKQRRIGEAKFPIDSLGLDDETVTYQDKPFSQLSTGEQIRISTAVAMALNPTLKIILIREGSLLDSEGLKVVIEIATEKGYQAWIEKVADEKGVGIYLEEGEIA